MVEEKLSKRDAGILFGIDIGEEILQITRYQVGMQEPETIGTHVGSDKFEIPLCMFIPSEEGTWYYGENALKYKDKEDGVFIGELWKGSLESRRVVVLGKCYLVRELFAVFIRRILKLGMGVTSIGMLEGVVFTVHGLDQPAILELQEIAKLLEIPPENVFFQDYLESFASYVLNQKRELWAREVFLFYFKKGRIYGYQMIVDQRVAPNRIYIEKVLDNEEQNFDEEFHKKAEAATQMDSWFMNKTVELFGKRLISSVFLIGEGFEHDWMKESLQYICHGRRVFQGRNLFTKGATYACMELLGIKESQGIYQGIHALSVEVRIPVLIGDREEYMYASKGVEPWYRAGLEMECIPDDCSEVKIELLKKGQDTQVIKLHLEALPERPNLATRLWIQVCFTSRDNARITVVDRGFGELYESSGMEWKKDIPL